MRLGSDGTVAFRYAPRRNAQLRARLGGATAVASRPIKVSADFPMTIRRRDAGGRRPRLVVKVRASRRAQVRRRPVYGYLVRATKPWRRVVRARWHHAERSATATLHYPRSRLGLGDRWLVCTRERTPDDFGRPKRIDRLCGSRTLPR